MRVSLVHPSLVGGVGKGGSERKERGLETFQVRQVGVMVEKRGEGRNMAQLSPLKKPIPLNHALPVMPVEVSSPCVQDDTQTPAHLPPCNTSSSYQEHRST